MTKEEVLGSVEALAGDLPHVPHVRKSGLNILDLDTRGPAQTHTDVVDDVLAADTGPMSLRKVRKVVLPSFENRKTNHNKSS